MECSRQDLIGILWKNLSFFLWLAVVMTCVKSLDTLWFALWVGGGLNAVGGGPELAQASLIGR